MEGLNDGEENQYFEDNPKIIPLFEIDVVEVLTPYLGDDDKEADDPIDDKTIMESRHQHEAMEREMQVSQHVHTSVLEQLNLVDNDTEPKTMLIAKEMQSTDKTRLTEILRQYRDVFAWSFKDMKGVDPSFCQHQINLLKDAMPVQQRRYHLNLNYAVKVKEEIDKLF